METTLNTHMNNYSNSNMINRRGRRIVRIFIYLGVTVILLMVTMLKVTNTHTDRSVRMWVDIPNSFPWRYCLREYNGVATLVACMKVRIDNG